MELIDYFALMKQHEHQNNMRMEGEDKVQKTMQQPKHANTSQPGEMKQSGNRKINKWKLKMHLYNQETFTITRWGQIIMKLCYY